jgi:hypothetical protein
MFLLTLNPSAPRVWRLRYENDEPVTIEAHTFDEALCAWWSGFADNWREVLADLQVELSGGCAGVLTFWVYVGSAGADGEEWATISLQDITDEYRGLESGELIECVDIEDMRRRRQTRQRKPKHIEDKAQAEAEKQEAERQAAIRKYRALMAAMKGK